MTTVSNQSMSTPPAFTRAFKSVNITPSASLVTVQAHGFLVVPALIQATLVCLTAELGYSIGDVCLLPSGVATGTGVTGVDATNVTCALQGTPQIPGKASGTITAITPANWALVLRCWV